MAKIAVELETALADRAVTGAPGRQSAGLLAEGSGWAVHDVVCTCGPQDRPYEEQHTHVAVAIVAAGTFQYRSHSRSGSGSELMTPGSLLLGNAGQVFECGHAHGTGDRCLSFHYTPDYFAQTAATAGAPPSTRCFHILRIPPLRVLSSLIARGCAALTGAANATWEELSIELAARSIQLSAGLSPNSKSSPPGAEARVARAVRMIEGHSAAELTVEKLAREARLSPYHFLRTFRVWTGLTPHQYVLRQRLRNAATRLGRQRGVRGTSILEIALDCGFADVSNFNRAFRTEFGVSPRLYRKLHG